MTGFQNSVQTLPSLPVTLLGKHLGEIKGQKETLIEHYIHTMITTRLRPLTELRVHLTYNSNYKGQETEQSKKLLLKIM